MVTEFFKDLCFDEFQSSIGAIRVLFAASEDTANGDREEWSVV
jgi:hypothetical protein